MGIVIPDHVPALGVIPGTDAAGRAEAEELPDSSGRMSAWRI